MNILFLCTGNSCRSQMAEGWARHIGAGRVSARSAGIEIHGKNPLAIAVMREAGIDISTQESTRVSPEMIAQADVVVTVCGHADEHCPALPPGKRKLHWPVADPARAVGTQAEILRQYRHARDEIRQRVARMLQDTQPLAGPDR